MTDREKSNGQNAEHPPPTAPPPPSSQEDPLHQVVNGAKTIASRAQRYYQDTVTPAFERSGVRDFYYNKIAPTTKHAAQSVTQAVNDQHTKLVSIPISRTAIVLLVLSVVTTISTFLPMGPSSIG